MQPFPAAIVAIGLLALLSACASYQDRCLEQGYESGSPEFSNCLEKKISQAYQDSRNRRRHQMPGGGGGG